MCFWRWDKPVGNYKLGGLDTFIPHLNAQYVFPFAPL